MANYIDVSPEILRWAIDRSGLPIEHFDKQMHAWLEGEKRPTLRQLTEFARKAMVPRGYLFLSQPPQEDLPAPDYRARGDEGVRRPSPNLLDTLFQMKRRQEWMRDYLVDSGCNPLPFVGSASLVDSASTIAQRMRDELGLAIDWASRQQSWEHSLRHLRSRIEAAGILIFISGVVGTNTHRRLDPDEFQGFVLIDPFAPLIFVNGADFKVAQMFTIAHELAHVWTGESAIFELDATQARGGGVESYCNQVAAEFLVPQEQLITSWPVGARADAMIKTLARQFKVSEIVIARRAKDVGLLSLDQFFEFYRQSVRHEQNRKDDEESGGDFWRTQNVRIGKRFGNAVISAAEDGRISYTDAYELTGLHGATFDKYAQLLQEGGANV